MKKRLILIILSLSMIFSASAYAQPDISVTVNGSLLETPVAPQIVNDRTMLPMRAIFESLGAKVSWFGDEQIIIATKDDTFITLKIGVPKMSIQTIGSTENVAVSLDTAPYIDSDYTLVPVRAVAEALKAKVDWVQENGAVVITTE